MVKPKLQVPACTTHSGPASQSWNCKSNNRHACGGIHSEDNCTWQWLSSSFYHEFRNPPAHHWPNPLASPQTLWSQVSQGLPTYIAKVRCDNLRLYITLKKTITSPHSIWWEIKSNESVKSLTKTISCLWQSTMAVFPHPKLQIIKKNLLSLSFFLQEDILVRKYTSGRDPWFRPHDSCPSQTRPAEL